jgi:hypothetical protein
MCPWCWLSPVCPCRRGGGPHGLTLPVGTAIVAVARRLRRRLSARRFRSKGGFRDARAHGANVAAEVDRPFS